VGRIGKLLSFVRAVVGTTKTSDVKFDRGGGDIRTAQHFSDPGDDSFPLPGDFLAILEQAGTGRDSSVGSVDPKNLQKSIAGDKRVYARDANGDQIVELWLHNDGSASLSNANGSVLLRVDGGVLTTTPLSTFDADADGSIAGTNGNGDFELQAGGDFVVNGVTIAANGDVTIPNSLTLATKEIADHNHAQANDSGGNTEQDTGVNQ